MKASDNEYPSLLVKEGTVPANPAAGDQRLYIDSADHVLKRVNSSGTVVAVGAGGSSLWSPDDIPASPHASDQEFNATLSGWSTLGSLDTSEANVIPSQYHISKTTSGNQYDGIYRACPSVPFTMTMRLRDFTAWTLYQSIGLILLDAGPAKLYTFGSFFNNNIQYSYMKANVGGTRGTYVDTPLYGQYRNYIRMVVTDGAHVANQISRDGLQWQTVHTGIDSGLATPAYFGVYVHGYSAVDVEGYVDWIRFA